MLPAFDQNITLNLVPTKTPYTWRGAPIYGIRFSSSSNVTNGQVVYTFREPAVMSPDTDTCFRLIHVVGWYNLGGHIFYCGQALSLINNAGVTVKGFHINASGQLRFNGNTIQGCDVVLYYARCRQ